MNDNHFGSYNLDTYDSRTVQQIGLYRNVLFRGFRKKLSIYHKLHRPVVKLITLFSYLERGSILRRNGSLKRSIKLYRREV